MTTITANGTAHTIPYDNSGNPSNWYNGSKSYSGLTWQNGRQLAQITTGGKTSKYTYDADGIRSTKDVNGTKHEYRTLNGKVVWEKIGEGTSAKIMVFSYDAQGRPFGFKFSKNNGASYTNYFYALNQQGDVMKIFRPITVKDADGNVTGYTEKTYATYTYDAWGKLTGILDSGGNNLINKQTTSTALANLNPLRYRGYYYDNETGFYYLQSRYYDPAVKRFINADIYASTDSADTVSCNMFAYCGNNPVMRSDETGELWSWLKKAVAVVAVAAAVITATVVTCVTCGAGSVAGVAMISATVTMAARATEVGILQGRKSAKEGRTSGKIATDVVEAIFDNGSKIIGLTPVTKSAGIALKHGLSADIEKLRGDAGFKHDPKIDWRESNALCFCCTCMGSHNCFCV